MNEYKLYTNKSISLATFLGGPLSGCYLMFHNFKALGNEFAAKNALFWGVIATLAILAALFFLPDEFHEKTPNQLIPFVYSGIIYWVVYKTQGNAIQNHIESGGQKASGWAAAGIGLAGMAIMSAIVLPLILSQGPVELETMEFGGGHHVVYYDPSIDLEDVQKLGMALQTMGLFSAEMNYGVEFYEVGDGFELYLPIRKIAWKDKKLLFELKSFKSYLAKNVFDCEVKVAFFDEINGAVEFKWL